MSQSLRTRPIRIRSSTASKPRWARSTLSCGSVLVTCMNRDAFALPTQYTYGNAGRNLFSGPGFVNFDTSLSKTFPIHDRLAFEFRADAYNTFNHPTGLRLTETGLADDHVRQHHSTSTNMRIFEFMGRLSF